jgi:hypothetical protein
MWGELPGIYPAETVDKKNRKNNKEGEIFDD